MLLRPSALACIATCRTANVIPIRDFRGRLARLSVFIGIGPVFQNLSPDWVPRPDRRVVRRLVHNSRAFFFPVTSMGRARSQRYDVGWRCKYKKKHEDDDDADQRRVTKPETEEGGSAVSRCSDDRTIASGEPFVWHALQTAPDPEATCCCGSGSTEFDAELTPSR